MHRTSGLLCATNSLGFKFSTLEHVQGHLVFFSNLRARYGGREPLSQNRMFDWKIATLRPVELNEADETRRTT
jgi:hypothetical protein